MWSSVNERTLQPLVIADPSQPSHNQLTEDILDDKHKDTNIYPVDPIYKPLYTLWIQHDEIAWNAGEHRPSLDRTIFLNAPPKLQDALLCAMGILTIGDRVVLDVITSGDNWIEKITQPAIKAFINSQAARECVHNALYSQSLDISDSPNSYRNAMFYAKFMSGFQTFTQKYQKQTNLAMQLFVVMLCESLMFAGPFNVICYVASLGHIAVIRAINEQAMRDEDKHYLFYRQLSSMLKNKLPFSVAREMLEDFIPIIKAMCIKILDGYDDCCMNSQNLLQYIDYCVFNFMYENGLLTSKDKHILDYTPPQYMTANLHHIRDNLMESHSTIYKPTRGDILDTQLICEKFNTL